MVHYIFECTHTNLSFTFPFPIFLFFQQQHEQKESEPFYTIFVGSSQYTNNNNTVVVEVVVNGSAITDRNCNSVNGVQAVRSIIVAEYASMVVIVLPYRFYNQETLKREGSLYTSKQTWLEHKSNKISRWIDFIK